ncbi:MULTISPECIES: cell division ATP-binding protein FtsE [Carboxydocella]|uniref:Cell division ATP-binding protein FtsE n=2 Tax=Carboxydocella TaxID=178898 RepID=A0A1T4PYS2_9FIRM|nr:MULTISPECIES: cell division ATP-binding protein FtsE [Carboxydocella]AVX21254.1 cell division ATP-binding protein FtsE [Carboxydocella thermautotrophica]AVX31686.1 cell division ATP-binding protein FtsE [Carboxydocella thermautotrophica]SJZ96720.1 cell division ATP-binding protein FtsE [Carboxydocella sporoproducens DSM 16521]GAW29300.1 cell division ATP-binding protein FtsE [Carboxydocella sp. ULO1]GAW30748.1 cell division ATP-binding protein FtsE [Carboxydocella sp. JDF658]
MIELYNISKIYPNGVKALHDLTLKIGRGEFVFLVGPSGAGKSTLLKLLTREENPTRGQIYINGKNIVRMKNSEVPYLRRKIGVVFQDFRLLQDKTVFENVAFALRVAEASGKEIKRLVPGMLELVGLKGKENSFPRELSGGEQQRVAIARAMVNNPLMVIADEPTGNLDPDTSLGIMKLLADINKLGTTILMATHDKEMVNMMQKRVVALENGQIVRDEEKGVYGYED